MSRLPQGSVQLTDKRIEIISCACGCGRELNKYDGHYRTRTIIHGHATKGKTGIKRTRKIKTYPSISCECGCGELIQQSKTCHGSIRRFKVGHSKRGRIFRNLWKEIPSERATRTRAKKLRQYNKCDISNSQCLGRLESAHIDHDCYNNSKENLACLCRAHHSALDKNRLNFNDLYTWVPKRRPKK